MLVIICPRWAKTRALGDTSQSMGCKCGVYRSRCGGMIGRGARSARFANVYRLAMQMFCKRVLEARVVIVIVVVTDCHTLLAQKSQQQSAAYPFARAREVPNP